MTREQKRFLNNLTAAQASRLIAKFDGDPAVAADASDAAYAAFCRAWEMLNPNEYWQRVRLAGSVDFNLISMD